MSIGLLIIRLVAGVVFAGHGLQKLFGWFGGHGIEGTGGFFESLGYRPGRRMAIIGGLAETLGGLLLALGLLTPLGAAMVIGVMVNATLSVHLPKGLWATNGGYELPLMYAAIAAGLAFTGPGLLSIDRALGWNGGGLIWGVLALAFGLATGMALYGWRTARMRSLATVEPTVEDRRAA